MKQVLESGFITILFSLMFQDVTFIFFKRKPVKLLYTFRVLNLIILTVKKYILTSAKGNYKQNNSCQLKIIK